MCRSALAALLLLAAPAPALAAHSLTVQPNGISGCFTAAAGGGIMQDTADVTKTPVGDELDVAMGATASQGASFPDLYEGSFSYQCALLGAGTLGYGAASGALSLQTSSTPESLPPTPVNMANPPFQNNGRANGEGLLQMQFDDKGVVVSDTLALGTPVTLTFMVSLHSAELEVGRPPDPLLLDASATYAVRATDVDGGDAFFRLLVGNETVGLPLDTFVGNHVDLQGILSLHVVALAGRELGQIPYYPQADASVDAANTASYQLELPAGVGFETESGHDYTAAPEPAQALSLVAGALALAVARRRRAYAVHG